jgi:hypothetical protein
MKSRNGKIARLPRHVREELNERLERSEPGPQLLAWLNALPETKEVAEKHFASAPVNKQNLSEWRQGGFQEWLAGRNLTRTAHSDAVALLAASLAGLILRQIFGKPLHEKILE